MSTSLLPHLAGLPTELAGAVDDTYRDVMNHFLKGEWDDAQVDAGRFCEAALRYLEWKMTGRFTAIDGTKKPDRKATVNKAKNDTSLAPSLRAQVPQAIELSMDFRNNRNSAHLGSIDANKMDAMCVVQNVNWMVGEIVRLETQLAPTEVQRLLDQLAQRHVPLVQKVGDEPVLTQPGLGADEKALVFLYEQAKAVPMMTLRKWAGYGNSTRWRDGVIKNLEKRALVHVNRAGEVTLLMSGEVAAQQIILRAGGL